MSYNLNYEQEKHLKTIIDCPNEGHIFSYYLCDKLLNGEKKLISDFYIDGTDDRGIDFIIIRMNNKLITQENLLSNIKSFSANNVTISIFQCKNEKKTTSSMSQNEFIKVDSFLTSIARCCTNNQCIESCEIILNDRAKKFGNTLIDLFSYQDRIEDIYFEYNYVNTVIHLNEFETNKVKNDMGKNIDFTLRSIFSNVKTSYDAYSRIDLNLLYTAYYGYKKTLRGINKCIEDDSQEGLIGIINANEFFKCITDSESYDIELYQKNYNDIIFDNNVRSFLGNNKVNKSIVETCEKLVDKNPTRKFVAFWAKNNGITILCKDYKLNRNGVLDIFELKIINGLQTISSILKFIKKTKSLQTNDLNEIKLHIKIIKKQGLDEKEIQDIIIATNTQTQVKYLDLISINEDLRKLEFKLHDHKIDYIRKNKQLVKQNCDYTIKSNELLQLIITCFNQGPSSAKNNLETSLYPRNSDDDKILIDFKSYWHNNQKFTKLLQTIYVYDALKREQILRKDSEILKYAKLHTTFCIINIQNIATPITSKELNSAIKIMFKVFEYYKKDKKSNATIEQLSKSISSENIRLIIKNNKLI